MQHDAHLRLVCYIVAVQHDESLRLTADEALRHPWFSQHSICTVGRRPDPVASPDDVATAIEAASTSVFNNVLPISSYAAGV